MKGNPTLERVATHMTVGALLLILLVGISWNYRVLAAPPAKSSDQAFKNIQVLKGIPADQIVPAMQFISASLGVQCEHCHLEGAFDKDDKKPKQTARKMMEMMAAINKANFDNRREVTCYSCHRGNLKPVSIPIIPGDAAAERADAVKSPEPDSGQASDAATKQAVDSILEQYIASAGGTAAVQRVRSRIEKGTIDLGGKQFTVETYTQAPDKQVTVMHLPNGDSVTGSDGTVGWISVPGRHTQWMSDSELDSTRLEADLHLPLRMRQVFSDLHLEPPQKIEGHDVSVIAGVREGKPPVRFYFDASSRALLRLVRYVETPLGLNPVQIDYSDYRDSGGVKVPYRRVVARPRGRYTIQIEEVTNNAPIDRDRFAPPPSPNP